MTTEIIMAVVFSNETVSLLLKKKDYLSYCPLNGKKDRIFQGYSNIQHFYGTRLEHETFFRVKIEPRARHLNTNTFSPVLLVFF